MDKKVIGANLAVNGEVGPRSEGNTKGSPFRASLSDGMNPGGVLLSHTVTRAVPSAP